MKIKTAIKTVIPCAALTLLAAAFIIYPERYIECCLKGFAMWAECVLPSLFPFMVITLVMIKAGFAEKAALPLKKVTGIFRLPPSAAVCLVMSICSGYPAGSRAVAEFYENGYISSTDCKKLSALCSTSGPLFIIGSVGVRMFEDKAAGWKILAAHILAVLIIGLALALFSKKEESVKPLRRSSGGNLIYDCFYGAVISVAVAGGFIAFFCVTAQVIEDFNILLPLQKILCPLFGEEVSFAVCTGLIEATAGCRALSSSGAKLAVPLAGFLITFGGISIILQQLSYFTKAKVKPAHFVAVKFIQGLVCFLMLLPFA